MADGKADKKDYVLLRENRRKNLRKELLVLKVKGNDGKGAFFGYAKTISREGMFISSVNPRPMGEEFEISFKLPEAGLTVRCNCVVIWRQEYNPKPKHEPGMGIRFIDLPYDIGEKIDEWIRTDAGKGSKKGG
ncbi:MAG: PilZ domain-containing protein [Deltaproteobacteria bacterium]|nr:PilZ domain-containing protein [Deltaproteobacteria bacterium]